MTAEFQYGLLGRVVIRSLLSIYSANVKKGQLFDICFFAAIGQLPYANLANSILTSIKSMQSYKISNKLTRGKIQRVPENLDNPKDGHTLEQG